jgi:predicted transglutaminase-like cysteine proteinase
MTGDILACPAINPFLTIVWRRPPRSDILSGVSFARRPKPMAFGQRSGLGRVQVLIHDHHRGLEKRGDEVTYSYARRARCERNRRPPGPRRIRATCTPLRNHEAATGWVDFCAREPTECADPTTAPRTLVLSADVWSDLVRVNDWVNETVKPLTDIEHWGVVERWSYPDDGYGDCEDSVLLQRRILMESGWPREALFITVVLKDKNEGHAVLTVTTDKGDYVLDNLNKNIMLWSATGYRFVKRQSQANPNIWVALGRQPTIVTAASNSLAQFKKHGNFWWVSSGARSKGRATPF